MAFDRQARMTEAAHEKPDSTEESVSYARQPQGGEGTQVAPVSSVGEGEGHSDSGSYSAEVPKSREEEFSATLAHSAFALVCSSFVIFELIFLVFFSSKFWFAVNISFFFLPVALVCLVVAHISLSWLESSRGCSIFSSVFHGLPPIVYRKWVKIDEKDFPGGIRFGNRTAVWSAIDDVRLTFFGNLRLSSRSASGPPVLETRGKRTIDRNPPVLLFKIPFGAASKSDQKRLVETLVKNNPNCYVHERLRSEIEKAEPPGSAMVLNIVSLAMVLFFTDVVYSTLSYLETLKNYHLCKQTAEELSDRKTAAAYFRSADELWLHPFPLSFVTQKMFRTEGTKSGILQCRAEAQWAMGKRKEAIQSMRDALEEHGKNFRAELKLARMLVDDGDFTGAFNVLDGATDKAKKAFVPRLYYLALLKSKTQDSKQTQTETQDYYDRSLEALDKELFKDVTDWPPGVSPYLPDVWHREDLDFVMSRLLNIRAGTTTEKATTEKATTEKATTEKATTEK